MLLRLWRDMVDSRENVETRKVLRGIKPFTLASLPEGRFGRVVGRCVAIGDGHLVAPFTERRCLAYALSSEGRERRVFDRDGVMFAIEAAGQRAVVDPRGAMYALTRNRIARRKTFEHPSEKQQALMEQIVGPGIIPDGIEFEEAVICEGDEIVLAGFAVRETDRTEHPDDPYRGVPTRLRLVGTRGQPLLIANDRRLV